MFIIYQHMHKKVL